MIVHGNLSFDADLTGGLVLAQTQIGGVAQAALCGQFRVIDLGHKLRRDPGDAGNLGFRCGNRGAPAHQRAQQGGQFGHGIFIETRPDLANIAQVAGFARGQCKRSERPSRRVTFHPADDDEFRPSAAFDLQPVGAAPAAIGTVAPFCDQPFAMGRADHREGVLRIAFDDRRQV